MVETVEGLVYFFCTCLSVLVLGALLFIKIKEGD